MLFSFLSIQLIEFENAIMDPVKEAYFQLKADLIPLTVIKLSHFDLPGIQQQLVNTISKAPNYFQQAPILIDLINLTDQSQIELGPLLEIFKKNQLVPVAIRNLQKKAESQAIANGLAILKSVANDKETKKVTTAPTINNQSPTKIITKPVRAGTQVYAKGGDLIILAAVNSGAECLADGNIHVHGPLRGKALAGINGDTRARIFCKSLEAELIAIAGHYQVSENLHAPQNTDGMIQIYLENQKIQIITI